MPQELALGSVVVKHRGPWAPVLLSIVTFGIYGLVRSCRINPERREAGATRRDEMLPSTKSAVSILAVTIGALVIVPSVVSWFKTIGRIKRTQALAGGPEVLDLGHRRGAPAARALRALPGPGRPEVTQDHLNRACQGTGRPRDPEDASPLPPVAAAQGEAA